MAKRLRQPRLPFPRPTTLAQREVNRIYAKRGSGRNLARKRETNRRWRKEHADDLRLVKKVEKLRRNYGLSYQDYERMVLEHGGVCAVCRRPETRPDERDPGRTKTLSVDHDHETGKVRGLLCYKCNLALGFLGDDVLRIEALADYLKRHLEKEVA